MFHPSVKSSPILLEACSVSFETYIVSSIEVLDNKRKNGEDEKDGDPENPFQIM